MQATPIRFNAPILLVVDLLSMLDSNQHMGDSPPRPNRLDESTRFLVRENLNPLRLQTFTQEFATSQISYPITPLQGFSGSCNINGIRTHHSLSAFG
jgi:hypothetical protein